MTTPPDRPDEQSTEEAAWGQQPSGGWGQPQPEPRPKMQPSPEPDHTRVLDPRVWSPRDRSPATQAGWEPSDRPSGGQPRYGAAPYDGPQLGAPQTGGQPPGAPQAGVPPYGGRLPTQQWPGDPRWPGDPQPGWGPSGQDRGGQAGQRPTPQWPGGQRGDRQEWGRAYPPLPEPRDRPARSRRPLVVVGVGVLVIAVVAVLGFGTPGWFVTRVFDAAAMQTGVQKVLTEDYGLAGVTSVTCGKDVKVTRGAMVTCDATVGGELKRVPIRVTSDSGTYEVGTPR